MSSRTERWVLAVRTCRPSSCPLPARRVLSAPPAVEVDDDVGARHHVQAQFPGCGQRQLGAVGDRGAGAVVDAGGVGLVAAGGLSHDLVSEKQGFVDEELDREVLRLLGEGPRVALAEISDERMVQSGNGTAEIRNWIVLAGALPEQARGTIVAYEAMAITGTAQAIFDCDG